MIDIRSATNALMKPSLASVPFCLVSCEVANVSLVDYVPMVLKLKVLANGVDF